jgi:hypothetical protein
MSDIIRGGITKEQAANSQANLKAFYKELRVAMERMVELSSAAQRYWPISNKPRK